MQELINYLSQSNAWVAPCLITELVLAIYTTKSSKKTLKELKETKRIRLRKSLEVPNISKIMLPPELKIDVNRLLINFEDNEKFDKKILYFFLKMNQHFKDEDLMILYNNIQDIIVNRNSKLKSILFRLSDAVGLYDDETNSIYINQKEDDDTLYHELFHMATSYCDDTFLYSGFHQNVYNSENSENNFNLGNAINEGYTEIMTNRYFNADIEYSGYSYFIKIANSIEKIVEQNKMEKLYLHADLKGLIDELSKYSTVEETMDFIKNVDFILENEKDAKKDIMASVYVNSCRQRVALYLENAYKEKLKKGYYKGIIKAEEVTSKFENFSLDYCIQDPYEDKRIYQVELNENKYIELYNSLCNSVGIISKYDEDLEIIDIDSVNLKSPI